VPDSIKQESNLRAIVKTHSISHLCGMVYGHNAAEVHRELPLELVVLLSGLSIEPVTQTKLQARERLTVPNQPLTAPTIHLAGSCLSLL
jgi:hypothetical protein